MKTIWLGLGLLACTSAPAQWRFSGLDTAHGDAELRLGAKVGRDDAHLRNLQFRVTSGLTKWLRAQLVTRWRQDGDTPQPFRADLDEGYLQSSALNTGKGFRVSTDLKLGVVRFVHFPYPDEIATFDQVPGIRDIIGGPATDYRGALFTAELENSSGVGAHVACVKWGFGPRTDTNVTEGYAFFRKGNDWRLEIRAGGIANRAEPLGLTARMGVDVFVGKRLGPISIGLLYERRGSERAFTGVSVRLGQGPVTRAAGVATLDYQRAPEGLSAEVSVARVRFGERRGAERGDTLVGEVRASRLRTLWQGGYSRNQAEFVRSSWGTTSGSGTYMVADETPWYLDAEALVSAHTDLGASWLRDRQGPGQFRQDVVYRVYKRQSRAAATEITTALSGLAAALSALR